MAISSLCSLYSSSKSGSSRTHGPQYVAQRLMNTGFPFEALIENVLPSNSSVSKSGSLLPTSYPVGISALSAVCACCTDCSSFLCNDGSRKLNQISANAREAKAMHHVTFSNSFLFFSAPGLSPEHPPSGAFRVKLPAFIEIAFCAHTSIHFPQFMHSRSPTFRTSIPQFLTHAPQPLQRFLSTFTPIMLNLPNRLYIAPSGHIKRQKAR